MTDEQFDEFVDNCYNELEAKQNKMWKDYKLGLYDEYWFNQIKKTLQFKLDNAVKIEFKIICIGTWAHKGETWMWSWANNSMTDEYRKDSEELKTLIGKTGFDIFHLEGFNCDEVMAYELVAVSINYLNAIRMYRIPGETSHLYVAIMKEYK